MKPVLDTPQLAAGRMGGFILLRLTVFLLVMTASAGCANLGTYNAATGRREFIVIPTGDEIAMGEKTHAQVLAQYPLSKDQAATARLNRIGRRLAQISDRQDYTYHFYLLETPDLNAFTTPGGNIYVFTGLAAQLPSDDALAAVLAHEMGHCAARHTIKKFQAAVGYEWVSGLLIGGLQAEEQVKRIAALSSQAVMSLVFSAYSRQDEYEADRLGLKYMHLAGFSLDGMRTVLQTLEAHSHGDGGMLLLRSHPFLKDRVQAVDQEMRRIRSQG